MSRDVCVKETNKAMLGTINLDIDVDIAEEGIEVFVDIIVDYNGQYYKTRNVYICHRQACAARAQHLESSRR